MQSYKWLVEGEVPQPVVTVAGLDNWRDTNVTFEVWYEQVDVAPDGTPQYRCRYLADHKSEAFVLVHFPNGEDEQFEVLALTGWPAVDEHHATHGDGRKPLFNDDANATMH